MGKLVKPYPGMVITEDVVFEPGDYSFQGGPGLVIAAHGITVNGNGAVIRGRGKKGRIHSYSGVGIYSNGYTKVTVKGLSVSGFQLGMKVMNASGWAIERNDLSDNFTDPDYGWGDGEPYGALLLERVSDSRISDNEGSRVWNGLHLKYSDRNTVSGNTFSHCTNVCLKLWHSSDNEIVRNVMNYGIRIAPGEVHARDSASVLMESGSNGNRVMHNDFTHGGDGVFIRSLNGFVSTGNHFEGNDASYAHNNAWEVWDPGNVFIRNKGNHSSYGFWLGGSCHAVLIENEAAYNGLVKANAPEPFGNAGIAVVHGSSSHFVMRGNLIHHNKSVGLAIGFKEGYEACHWIVEHNEITDNETYGVYLKHAKQLYFAGNRITGNGSGDLMRDMNVTDVTVRDTAGPSPTAKAVLRTAYPQAGKPVVVDASSSVSAEAGKLSYRWDMGDGNLRDGVKVEHVYPEPGFYRVGLTVTGELGGADLAWIDLYVLADEAQVRYRPDVLSAKLDYGASDGWAVIAADSSGGVASRSSLLLTSSSTLVRLRMDIPAEVSADIRKGNPGELLFWIRFSHEQRDGFPSAAMTIRLKKDEISVVQWVCTRPLFDWTQIHSEARYGWSLVRLPLSGEPDGWVSSSTVGRPSAEGPGQLEIQIDSRGGEYSIRIDEIVFV